MLSGLILSVCLVGAPVPKHLFPPPPPEPIRPGFTWWFNHYQLQVVRVDGDMVTYRCLSHPGYEFPGCNGYREPNQQSREQVLRELADYYQHPPLYGHPEWLYRR